MLAEDLKMIKDAELDIELLHRDNEKLCAKNNKDIAELEGKIKSTEYILEKELKASKEDKIECKFDGYKGTVGFYEQGDEWIYDTETISDIHAICPKSAKRYIRTTTIETLIKNNIKEDILLGKIGLPSVTKIPRDPKFRYTIKKMK